MSRRRHGGSSCDYPRTARVNELVREIVADELERIDDPRLEWVSVTAVDVTAELSNGTVYFSSLEGPTGDPDILAALAGHRVRLQRAIGRQARLRRTPELAFRVDIGVREGLRVEEILREIAPSDAADSTPPVASDGAASEGSAADRVASHGSASDGSASDGSASDGAASEGSAADRVASHGSAAAAGEADRRERRADPGGSGGG
jgi:ribosome-binding factor A